MAWEKRGNHRYYYATKKVRGRVVKVYMGNGSLASAIAQLEQVGTLAIQAQRQENQAKLDMMRRDVLDFQHVAEETSRDLLGLASLCLRARGYHQPKRGP